MVVLEGMVLEQEGVVLDWVSPPTNYTYSLIYPLIVFYILFHHLGQYIPPHHNIILQYSDRRKYIPSLK